MTDAERLAACSSGYVEAPAGYGKTRLIADAVRFSHGKELILTHTHAGVNALRKHLHEVRAEPRSYQVETIAGWALRYCRAYPVTSGIPQDAPLNGLDWNSVYRGAINVLRAPVRVVLAQSYSGLYVDEYQDCTIGQHELVAECAKVLPCRAIGDPLQGIFEFGGSALVTNQLIVATFAEQLPPLPVAWRWKHATDLGRWLAGVRQTLCTAGEVDLRGELPSCVSWIQLPDGAAFNVQRDTCQQMIARIPPKDRLVAIYGPEEFNQERKLATVLWGQYDLVEPIACRDLYEAAGAFEAATGKNRAVAVLEFAEKTLTKVSTEMKPIKNALAAGKDVLAAGKSHPAQAKALARVAAQRDWNSVLEALVSLRSVSGAKPKRRELLVEMIRALRELAAGDSTTAQEAVAVVRNRTSLLGRRMGRLTLGRTVLVKGLEFDHSILVNAGSLDTNNLYVALTRASKTLTILSGSDRLRPSDNDRPRAALRCNRVSDSAMLF